MLSIFKFSASLTVKTINLCTSIQEMAESNEIEGEQFFPLIGSSAETAQCVLDYYFKEVLDGSKDAGSYFKPVIGCLGFIGGICSLVEADHSMHESYRQGDYAQAIGHGITGIGSWVTALGEVGQIMEVGEVLALFELMSGVGAVIGIAGLLWICLDPHLDEQEKIAAHCCFGVDRDKELDVKDVKWLSESLSGDTEAPTQARINFLAAFVVVRSDDKFGTRKKYARKWKTTLEIRTSYLPRGSVFEIRHRSVEGHSEEQPWETAAVIVDGSPKQPRLMREDGDIYIWAKDSTEFTVEFFHPQHTILIRLNIGGEAETWERGSFSIPTADSISVWRSMSASGAACKPSIGFRNPANVSRSSGSG